MPEVVQRRRLPAEQARQRILEAAQKRLREVGPQGLRLTDVATDLGITHQAILHHFSSRAGLLSEVASDAIARLTLELIDALRSHSERPDDRELLERVFRTFGEDGQARAIAWLELSGLTPSASATDDTGHSLRRVAEVLHERRGAGRVSENTLFTILLGSLAVFGDAIAGAGMRRSAGLDEDPETVRRFRDWLSELLVAQIRRGDGEPTQ